MPKGEERKKIREKINNLKKEMEIKKS